MPPRARPQHFLKSPEEMRALFAHLPAALETAARPAEECAPIGFEGWKFPEAHVPPGETPFSVLWQKSFAGLKERYRPLTREAVERLRYEIGIMDAKGFSPYFLAVDEIAAQARAWGLRTIGRGSAANSLVSHCLGLTHVDPLAHGLFFERLLICHSRGNGNPELQNMDSCFRRNDKRCNKTEIVALPFIGGE